MDLREMGDFLLAREEDPFWAISLIPTEDLGDFSSIRWKLFLVVVREGLNLGSSNGTDAPP